MIYVERGVEPNGFASQANKWREEFEEKRRKDFKYTPTQFWALVRKRKAMKDYVSFLSKTFHDKCAYCESQMKHVSAEHVEHYRPKSRPEFCNHMFTWENWLISCEKCNTWKGTKFPYCKDNLPCFIDPTNENPEKHIDFLEAHILGKTDRGTITIEEIGLRRSELIEYRKYWLSMIIDPLLLLLICGESEAKSEARTLLIWAMQSNAPYTAMTRTYLSRKIPKLASPATPHPFVDIDEPLKRIKERVKKYHSHLQKVL